MTHPMTLTLLAQYISDPQRQPTDYIARAADYGTDAQNDLIQLIARYLQLTDASADPALLDLDLDDLLAALDPDD